MKSEELEFSWKILIDGKVLKGGSWIKDGWLRGYRVDWRRADSLSCHVGNTISSNLVFVMKTSHLVWSYHFRVNRTSHVVFVSPLGSRVRYKLNCINSPSFVFVSCCNSGFSQKSCFISCAFLEKLSLILWLVSSSLLFVPLCIPQFNKLEKLWSIWIRDKNWLLYRKLRSMDIIMRVCKVDG
jgi:hypothetical protein